MSKGVGNLMRGWLSLAGVAVLAMCGCRSVPPEVPAPSQEQARPLRMSQAPKAKLLDETPLIVQDVAPERVAGEEDTFVFPERKAPPETKVSLGEYPDKLIKGIADPDSLLKVQLNFDASPLTEIVPLFGTLLNFSYLIDPSVKGAVTMTVDSEMSAREAWQMFEHILWLAGAYASRNPGFVHVMPFSKMPQERRLLVRHDPAANVDVAFIPIHNTKSAELLANVKPFMTDGASLTDIVRLNSLLIVETPSNMPKLHELIKRLDEKGEAGWPHVALRCHQVDAETVLQELSALLPVIGFPVAASGPSGGQVKLTAIPRLQVIVASAAMREVLDEVKKWVGVLDKQDAAEQQNIFFYNVRHSTAEQLSEALGVFFNTSGSQVSKSASTTKSSSSKASPTAGAAANASKPSTPAKLKNLEPGQTETIFDTPVVIYAEGKQNRLVIKTTKRAYAMVEALLKRLDAPVRQVLIEATIAEIQLTKSTEFGFAYAAQARGGDITFGLNNSAFVDDNGSATWVTTINNKLGVKDARKVGSAAQLGFKGGSSLAFVQAIAGESNVTVLSAPQILALSDEEATIDVGKSISLKTQSRTTSTSDEIDSTFERVKTGTKLVVTPHITAGNEVRMELQQEISSPAPAASGQELSERDINEKVLTTTMVIPDGGTIMMGGLIDSTTEKNSTGVPILRDIPILGYLFKRNFDKTDRSELLVLITVNVVDPENGTDQLTHRYQAALDEIRKQMDLR